MDSNNNNNNKQLKYVLSHNSQIWDPKNFEDNLCLWHCLAYALYNPPNEKSRHAKAVEMLCTFSGIDNGNKKSKNREAIMFANNYEGFGGDMADVCTKFNICITVFGAEYMGGLRVRYEILDTYRPEYTDIPKGQTDQIKHINLLMLTKEQNGGSNHFMYIRDAELLAA
jgi:hypothetical protein